MKSFFAKLIGHLFDVRHYTPILITQLKTNFYRPVTYIEHYISIAAIIITLAVCYFIYNN